MYGVNNVILKLLAKMLEKKLYYSFYNGLGWRLCKSFKDVPERNQREGFVRKHFMDIFEYQQAKYRCINHI